MKKLPLQKRTLALLSIIIPLFILFIYVAMYSGPLAPVSVVLTTVENKSISPALFGIGTVEARYTYKIGPTYPGRVKFLKVDVGDNVKKGQVLGEMEPVDLDERIRAQAAALKRANAQLREAQARKDYAKAQALRYKQLFKVHSTSEEVLASKKQDLVVAQASLTAAREEVSRLHADLNALKAQRKNLSLISPVDGLVVARDIEPGTTVVAGQSVLELIEPNNLWVNARFDQVRAHGLTADLPVKIVLRSQAGKILTGNILRVEPLADSVTEETLAKVIFDQIPVPMPPIGELAEVTVILSPLEKAPVIPNAAIRRIDGKLGVWQVIDNKLHFTPISLGIADLDGNVQVRKGLNVGDRIVVYSENALNKHKRIHIIDYIPDVKQ